MRKAVTRKSWKAETDHYSTEVQGMLYKIWTERPPKKIHEHPIQVKTSLPCTRFHEQSRSICIKCPQNFQSAENPLSTILFEKFMFHIYMHQSTAPRGHCALWLAGRKMMASEKERLVQHHEQNRLSKNIPKPCRHCEFLSSYGPASSYSNHRRSSP
jgi:hypothetical protein